MALGYLFNRRAAAAFAATLRSLTGIVSFFGLGPIFLANGLVTFFFANGLVTFFFAFFTTFLFIMPRRYQIPGDLFYHCVRRWGYVRSITIKFEDL